MFGEQLNEETLRSLSTVLSMDREKMEQTTINKLRIELEYLYDTSKDVLFNNSLQSKVDQDDVDLFNKIQGVYNVFMPNYEELMDN